MPKKKKTKSPQYVSPIGHLRHGHVVHPQDSEQYPDYSCTLLIPKTTDSKGLDDAINSVLMEEFGEVPTEFRDPRSTFTSDDGTEFTAVKFKKYKKYGRPSLVDRDNTPVGEEQALDLFISGAKCQVLFQVSAWESDSGPGASCWMKAVKHIAVGKDPSGSGVDLSLFGETPADEVDEVADLF